MATGAPLLPAGVQVFERGWLSSNSVLLTGRAQTAVVDSGYAKHASLTLAMVKGALGTAGLDTLVNTHLHSDHCGGNAALQAAFPGMRTLIPPGSVAAVQRWDEAALTYRPTGQACPRFHMDEALQPGACVTLGGMPWEVHAAPGHDPHSVVLFEPVSRTLISADALWENGFGVVFQELEGEQAFDEVSGTLDVIAALRPAIVVPGHGAVFTDVQGALSRARSRLDAFVANPFKHAGYAAKVLLKFRLLEVERVRRAELEAWAAATPYFGIVHARWFADLPFLLWTSRLLSELERSGAARQDADMVVNL